MTTFYRWALSRHRCRGSMAGGHRSLSDGPGHRIHRSSAPDPFKEKPPLMETAEELLTPRPDLKPLGWDWHAVHFFMATLPAALIILWGESEKRRLGVGTKLNIVKETEAQQQQHPDSNGGSDGSGGIHGSGGSSSTEGIGQGQQAAAASSGMAGTSGLLQDRIDELERAVAELRRAQQAPSPGPSSSFRTSPSSASSSSSSTAAATEQEGSPSPPRQQGETAAGGLQQPRSTDGRGAEGHDEAPSLLSSAFRAVTQYLMPGTAEGTDERQQQEEDGCGKAKGVGSAAASSVAAAAAAVKPSEMRTSGAAEAHDQHDQAITGSSSVSHQQDLPQPWWILRVLGLMSSRAQAGAGDVAVAEEGKTCGQGVEEKGGGRGEGGREPMKGSSKVAPGSHKQKQQQQQKSEDVVRLSEQGSDGGGSSSAGWWRRVW